MLWDCSSCGTQGINANTCKQCPFCGSPKETDDHREAEYKSATVVDATYAHAGADVTCHSCGAENKKRFSCINCGDALDTKFAKQIENFTYRNDTDWRNRHVKVDEKGEVAPPADIAVVDDHPAPTMPALGWKEELRTPPRREVFIPPPQVQKRTPWGLIGLAALVLVCIASGIGYIIHKRSVVEFVEAQAISAHWSYRLEREALVTKTKNETVRDGESADLPKNRYAETSRRIDLGVEDVFETKTIRNGCTRVEDDEYVDTDGTWVEEEIEVTYDCEKRVKTGTQRVYGTTYTYKIDIWEPMTPITAEGDTQTPVFPVWHPASSKERADGDPVTRFTITFSYTPDDEAYAIARPFDRTLWQSIKIGSVYRGIADGLASLRAIEGIDPEFATLAEKASP